VYFYPNVMGLIAD